MLRDAKNVCKHLVTDMSPYSFYEIFNLAAELFMNLEEEVSVLWMRRLGLLR